MASQVEVTDTLLRFVAFDLLGDPDSLDELTADSPLLEWGVLDSLNTARLLAFVAERFGVHIPMEFLVADHFRDVASITRLIGTLQGPQGNGAGPGPQGNGAGLAAQESARG